MDGELLYLDSSALVKLVLPEAESGALLESLSASLGADLGPIVTYDSNLATAAAGYGLEVLAPQAPSAADGAP